MTPKEILIAARAKIADPKHWTQSEPARNAAGLGTAATERAAVCWCSVGAVRHVVAKAMPAFDEGLNEQKRTALHLLERAMESGVGDFNDTHTHAEVLAKFDEAINAA